jgi:uncharacterized protein YuzB (UPF0349 family)
MSLGLVVVEVCERNDIASLILEELEEEYPEVAVIRTDCLNMCNMCRARPYAMVNHRRIYGNTTAQCLSKIKVAIEEEIKALN